MNSEIADLIYLDPPFNSKRMYSGAIGSKAAGVSFKDMWTWGDINEGYLEKLMSNKHIGLARFIQTIELSADKAMMAYIAYMTQRIIELHRVLKPTGSFYLHCDPTASHYLKQVLDFVFGRKNFRNEIVWCYKENDTATKYFPKKHDTIFFYTKSEKYTFNIQRGDFTEAQLKRYNHVIEGERYANMKGKMRKLEGGAKIRDWWDLPITQSPEREGYPTQKPLALLKRIIEASSNVGDVVLDPFCGCATTCVAAQQLGRKWVGIDIETKAVEVLVERLEGDGHIESDSQHDLKFKQKGVDFIHLTNAPQRTDVKIEEITPQTKNDIKKRLFKQQKGHCNGCNVELEIQHFEIDHIVPRAKGGGDYMENYQLLCGNCNRTKGARPMEYLIMKIKKRQEMLESTLTFGE
jgi:site-specific DNA-methyltransferase (adenine-specific)